MDSGYERDAKRRRVSGPGEAVIGDEVALKIRYRINAALEREDVKTILEELSKLNQWQPTTTSLKLGVFLNDLKKHAHSTDAIKESTRTLILKWKTSLSLIKPTGNRESSESVPATPSIRQESRDSLPATPSKRQDSRNSQPESPLDETYPVRTLSSDEISHKSLGSTMRDKCVAMLYASLAISTVVASKEILDVAVNIEAGVYVNAGRVLNDVYTARIRSLSFNLKVKENHKLRLKLLNKTLEVNRFVVMTTEELATDGKKQDMIEAKKLNLMDATTAEDTQAETDQFKCGKCRLRKCKYYQMQTRSADEPMTTFVTCMNCNHRWRFC